jgi:hypothetical protein
MYTAFWWKNLKERDHLENTGVDERIILRWIFRKCGGGGGAWTGLMWLITETNGLLL